MRWETVGNETFGEYLEISPLTACFTAKNWMNSWYAFTYVDRPRIETEVPLAKSWDNAMEKVLHERKEAWKKLAAL